MHSMPLRILLLLLLLPAVLSAYSKDIRWRVIWLTYDEALSKSAVAARLLVGTTFVAQIRQLFASTGDVFPCQWGRRPRRHGKMTAIPTIPTGAWHSDAASRAPEGHLRSCITPQLAEVDQAERVRPCLRRVPGALP